jgi:hypothetical protein
MVALFLYRGVFYFGFVDPISIIIINTIILYNLDGMPTCPDRRPAPPSLLLRQSCSARLWMGW